MSKDDLLSWVYSDPPCSAADEVALSAYYAGRAIVTPTNADADQLNSEMLGRLSAKKAVLLSMDEVLDATPDEREQFPEDFLNGTTVSGMPPHRLELCPGAVGICLRNIAPDKGLCNGTRFVVIRVHKHLLEVVLVTFPYTGRVEFLSRACCDSSAEGELPFTLRRRQFPVRLAWVMTINKSQGQEFKERLGIYLPRPVFAHGQLYVALSRGAGFSSVRAVVEQDEGGLQGIYKCVEGVQDGTYTLNVVDRSLLSNGGPSNGAPQAASPVMLEPTSECSIPGEGDSGDCEVTVGSSCGEAGVALPLAGCDGDDQVEDAVDSALLQETCCSQEDREGKRSGDSASATCPEVHEMTCTRCSGEGHLANDCPSYSLPPLRHPDATTRGAGPHMRQVDTNAILARTRRGRADGKDNNCLIDSLRQLLRPSAKVAVIRRSLQLRFRTGAAKVTASNFLQFDFHATAVMECLGIDPRLYTATCIDMVHQGHGDVVGRGARTIFLGRQGQNHFVPLFVRNPTV